MKRFFTYAIVVLILLGAAAYTERASIHDAWVALQKPQVEEVTFEDVAKETEDNGTHRTDETQGTQDADPREQALRKRR